MTQKKSISDSYKEKLYKEVGDKAVEKPWVFLVAVSVFLLILLGPSIIRLMSSYIRAWNGLQVTLRQCQ